MMSPENRDTAVPFIQEGRLLVDGAPVVLLGGQVHNSVPSSPAHVSRAWKHIADMHANVVIGGVGWAQVEPTEGVFDFGTVDAQLADARAVGLRLVLIWFGAFKNAASTYAPGWVRSDPARFDRAVVRPGPPGAWTYAGQTPKPVLSVFCDELRRADRRAFCALMQHLAEADREHTVVMVQIENEVGLLGDSRDRSPAALEAWNAPVSAEVAAHLALERASGGSGGGVREHGGRAWADLDGDAAHIDEIFMAWAFADYCEALAVAGKEITPLPMYVNAWLGPQPGQSRPGEYPSGGPTSRVLDVWKTVAPSVDVLAPDIYVDDVKPVLDTYARADNPLFVPESRFNTGAMMYAIGHHRAMGYSVFGIEDGRVDGQLARAYELLTPMQGVIARAQRDGRIEGVLLEDPAPTTFTLGAYDVTVRGTRELLDQLLLDAGVSGPPPPAPPPSETHTGLPAPADDRPFGLVIREDDDTFLVVGQGLTIDFSRPGHRVEIDHVEEGRFDADGWRPGRVLNGDERLQVVPMSELGIARIRVLTVPNPE